MFFFYGFVVPEPERVLGVHGRLFDGNGDRDVHDDVAEQGDS